MDYKKIGIEEKIELIEFNQTKQYFKEVYSSYTNGNYRSAVVMLWSVLVCDAIYKLQKLSQVYEDRKARKILAEIQEKQEREKKSPAWEMELFERLFQEKKMIGTPEITNIRDLQQKRHLCAHPILSEDSSLYTPNKETVKSLIINALDDFLLYKSYYDKDIFNVIANIMKDEDTFYTKKENVRKLISSYIPRMSPYVLLEVFKSFWSISFKVDNKDCDENRRHNTYACIFLSQEVMKREGLKTKLQDEIEFFSKLSTKKETVCYLFYFLCYQPWFFRNYPEAVRERIIDHREKTDDDNDPFNVCQIASCFTFDSPDDYFQFMIKCINEGVISDINKNNIDFIKENYDTLDCDARCLDMIIIYAEKSSSFDDADKRFSLIIDYYLDSFSLDQLNRLLQSFDGNSQIRGRKRATIDRNKIRNKADSLQVVP